MKILRLLKLNFKALQIMLPAFALSCGVSYAAGSKKLISLDNTDFVVDASLKEKVKHFKYNSKKYDKLSDHIGKIPLVIITPLDSNIILGGGDERRKFIDRLLSQLDNTYLYNLMSYNKVLQQRNALLKEGDFDDANLDLLSTYDKSLSDYGYQIYLKRKDCLDRIIGDIQNYYSFISEKQEQLIINEEVAQRLRDLVKALTTRRWIYDNSRERRSGIGTLYGYITR